MNQQKLDQHIDALLRAAGSALRHYTMQKSLDDMRAAMKAAVEELAKDDSKRLDFLESNQLETDSAGAWNEEPAFGVHRVSGGRNDRNWHCLGRGETLRDLAAQLRPDHADTVRSVAASLTTIADGQIPITPAPATGYRLGDGPRQRQLPKVQREARHRPEC